MSIFEHIFTDLTDQIEELDCKETDYFPYEEYRPGQLKIINQIQDMEDHNALVIHADTGSGKTIAMLSALLRRKQADEKIIIFVKTINQINPILREWQAIARFRQSVMDGNPIEEMMIMPLLGRDRLCKLPFERGNATIIDCDDPQYQSLEIWKKQQLRDRLVAVNKRYRLINWLNWRMIDTNISISSVKQLLQTRENCPYENVLSILQHADIVVTTYAYLKHDLFRRLMRLLRINEDKLLICIDEAHNLAYRLPIELYRASINEFMRIFGSSDLLGECNKLMRGIRYIDPTEIISTYQDELHKLRRFLRKTLMFNDESLIRIRPILLEIKAFLANIHTDTLLATPEKLTKPNVLPGEILKPIRNCKIRIFQSATLNPVAGYIQLFEFGKQTQVVDLIEYNRRELWNRNNEFRAFYSSSISSLSRFRKPELFGRFAKMVLELAEIAPNHVLVLTPSYEFSMRLYETIRNIEPDQNCIVEDASTATRKLHGTILKEDRKSLIIGNQRGKIIEGTEWIRNGRSIVSLVIFAGLSTEVPIEEEKLIIKKKDLRHSRTGNWPENFSINFQLLSGPNRVLVELSEEKMIGVH